MEGIGSVPHTCDFVAYRDGVLSAVRPIVRWVRNPMFEVGPGAVLGNEMLRGNILIGKGAIVTARHSSVAHSYQVRTRRRVSELV